MHGNSHMRNSLSATLPLIVAIMGLAACGPATPAVYELTDGALQLGSLHYAKAGCARCHGEKWNGEGSEAKRLKAERGIVASNFLTMKDPETTPVDYFKAITGGSPKIREHVHHQYTDAARWAMAHFLYSLAPALTGKKSVQREEAIVREMAEATRAYAAAAKQGNRRWEMGFFQPVAERPTAPSLATLLSGTAAAPEPARGAPSAARVKASHQDSGRGLDLYNSGCAGCHGAFGEGAPAGVRLGPIPCKTGTARCAVTFASRDVGGLAGRFAAVHQSASDAILPGYSSMAPDDVRAIFEFLGAE